MNKQSPLARITLRPAATHLRVAQPLGDDALARAVGGAAVVDGGCIPKLPWPW